MKKTAILIIFVFSITTRAQAMDIDCFASQVTQSYLQNETPQVSTIEREQKSYSTALLLGWSPIPGDGLYYTGHPVQGTLNLLLGGLGIVGILDGLYGFSMDEERWIPFSYGVLMYGSAYLWDALKTTSYAKKYKRRD